MWDAPCNGNASYNGKRGAYDLMWISSSTDGLDLLLEIPYDTGCFSSGEMSEAIVL
jgi:hypothetical protein